MMYMETLRDKPMHRHGLWVIDRTAVKTFHPHTIPNNFIAAHPNAALLFCLCLFVNELFAASVCYSYIVYDIKTYLNVK